MARGHCPRSAQEKARKKQKADTEAGDAAAMRVLHAPERVMNCTVYVLNGAVYHYEFLIPLVLDSIRLINVDNPKARDSHRQHWKKIKITL